MRRSDDRAFGFDGWYGGFRDRNDRHQSTQSYCSCYQFAFHFMYFPLFYDLALLEAFVR